MSREVKFRCDSVSEIPAVIQQIADMIRRGLAGGRVIITLGREKRSNAQNRLMWALLRDLSRQVVWHGMTLTEEDWKHVISAEIDGQRIVPGINVPFIACGVSTRNKSKAWFSEFFETAFAFGVEQGVQWSGKTYDEWGLVFGQYPVTEQQQQEVA